MTHVMTKTESIRCTLLCKSTTQERISKMPAITIDPLGVFLIGVQVGTFLTIWALRGKIPSKIQGYNKHRKK